MPADKNKTVEDAEPKTMEVVTILDSIEDKYFAEGNNAEDFGFIVYYNESPETKKGMFPPIMTLIDYDITRLGNTGVTSHRLNHIVELDLTDNLIADWLEIARLLKLFTGLGFLNLSNNLLRGPLPLESEDMKAIDFSGLRLPLQKLVLNGNRLDWSTVGVLISVMPQLEELHLGANNLENPSEESVFQHDNLRAIYLSCNPLTNFNKVVSVMKNCPQLEHLSAGQCPLNIEPETLNPQRDLPRLNYLNLTTSKVNSWPEVEVLEKFPSMTELRLQRIPLLNECTAHERRMLLVARLPKVEILNGGDKISKEEREDSERAFIRFYLDSEEKPARYFELEKVHGKLDPLVNINMKPEVQAEVIISHNDEIRTEKINLYQTVAQFKNLLQQWFGIAPQNMKLFYCDKDLVEMAGPEEMKWPQKELYTYNVRNGDKFILDEKVNLARMRTNSGHSPGLYQDASPKLYGSPGKISFNITPRVYGGKLSPPNRAGGPHDQAKAKVTKNLFGNNNNNNKKS